MRRAVHGRRGLADALHLQPAPRAAADAFAAALLAPDDAAADAPSVPLASVARELAKHVQLLDDAAARVSAAYAALQPGGA